MKLKAKPPLLGNESLEQEEFWDTTDIWDCAPRYSVSPQAMAEMRSMNGFLNMLCLSFTYHQKPMSLKIQAALISQKEAHGKEITTAYYPSENEKLIEDTLRQLAAFKIDGIYDTTKAKNGVTFTLHELRNELKLSGHTLSLAEIELSLKILARSIITIDGEFSSYNVSHTNSFFTELSTEPNIDDSDSKYFVRFHPWVKIVGVRAINQNE